MVGFIFLAPSATKKHSLFGSDSQYYIINCYFIGVISDAAICNFRFSISIPLNLQSHTLNRGKIESKFNLPEIHERHRNAFIESCEMSPLFDSSVSLQGQPD